MTDASGTPFQVAVDCADPHLLAAFWAAAMELEVEDHDAGIRALLDQGVADPAEVADRRDAEVARLVALGASRLWDGQQGPHRWVTLADPEGNEFCVG